MRACLVMWRGRRVRLPSSGTSDERSGRSFVVLGGYGQLGRAVVQRLARQGTTRITVAGRREERAHEASMALDEALPVSIEGRQAEAGDADTLAELLAEHDVLVHVAPLDDAAMRALRGGLSTAGGRAAIVSHDPRLVPEFRGARSRLEAAGASVVIDAGADPGLPGLVGNLAAEAHGEPEEVSIVARYAAPRVGRAGIADIVDGSTAAGWTFDDGCWRPVGLSAARVESYPGELRPALAMPTYLPELDALRDRYDLARLELRHGALNRLAGLVVAARQTLGDLIPRRLFIAAMERAVRLGGGSPYGLGIAAVAFGCGRECRVALAHRDVYAATAEVAAWSAVELADGPRPNAVSFAWELLADRSPARGLGARGFEVTLPSRW